MAVLKKKNETFDNYVLDVSYAELMAIKAAGESAGDPIADELAKSIGWYLSNIVPPPGVEEHPSKAAKDDPEVDELLPDGGETEEVPVPPGGGEGPVEIEDEKIKADPGPGGDDVSIEDEAEEILPAPAGL